MSTVLLLTIVSLLTRAIYGLPGNNIGIISTSNVTFDGILLTSDHVGLESLVTLPSKKYKYPILRG